MCRGPNFPMVRANFPQERLRAAGETECERRIPMRRRRATLVAVTIFAGAALIASCAKPYHEETERYVFVATNINLPYWRGAAGGVFFAGGRLAVSRGNNGSTPHAPTPAGGRNLRVAEGSPPRAEG